MHNSIIKCRGQDWWAQSNYYFNDILIEFIWDIGDYILVEKTTITKDNVLTALLETKKLSNQVVHLILNKFLCWSLNNIMVRVNCEENIMIEEMIILNHTLERMWSVTIATQKWHIRKRYYEGLST